NRVKFKEKAKALGLFRVYTVQIEAGTDILQLCNELNRSENVQWAEPVYIIPQDVIPNDPMYGLQTQIPQMHIPEAWDVVKGDSTVPIGIIDSGVDWKHSDLKDIIWVNPGEDIDSNGVITAADSNGVDDDNNGFIDDFIGWDWVEGVNNADPIEDGDVQDNNPMDVNGHGSHCAGLAAAATNNSVGIAGVSWGCSIMPLRIGWLNNEGDGIGYSTWMSQAFIYAADNGAKVTSLSYGNSAVVLEGARYAFINDVAVFTSAGNGNNSIFDPLSQVPWVMNVAAVDPYDVKAWYSNFGPEITISAPGGDHNPGLWSTTPNNEPNGNSYFNAYSGTSMASPVAAGLIGLIRSQHPEWSVAQSYYQLAGTADDLDSNNPAYAGMLGYGRINGYRAVTETVTPKPNLMLNYVEFFDPAGNNNGLAEPGENIEIVAHIENRWAGASNVTATIISNDARISVITASAQFDTVYGLEDFPTDNNNSDSPVIIHIADNLPPGNIPISLVIENADFIDTFKVDIPVHTLVLFVDDHLGGGNGEDMPISKYYEEAFDNLGIAYEYWLNEETIDSSYIIKFPIVVWDCEWAFPSLTESDRNVLSYYLENGGNLFISGQDIGWDLCDLTAMNNQCYTTGGESKTWYETYLSSIYLSDGGGSGPISPSDDTTYFKLPSFDFIQPGREDFSYPSEIEPTSQGISVLTYKNGTSAAVASEYPYNTIYFAFGGWEAISDSTIRQNAMQQVLNHFSNINAEVTWLSNTEFRGPFHIETQLNNNKNMIHTELWYRYNEESWTTIAMTDQGNGLYTTELPAITTEYANIEYFVFFKADDGMYYVNSIHRFYAGPDQTPPYANDYLLPHDNIDQTGPYYCSIEIFDDISVDTNNVKVHFLAPGIPEDSSLIAFESEHTWSGAFQFNTPIPDSDSVMYYFTFNDNGATTTHYSRLPEQGYLSFKIVKHAILDDFEEGLFLWNNDGNVWQILTNEYLVHSGSSCLISGNGISYPPNYHTSVELKQPINLKTRNAARIQFWETNKLEQKTDSTFFEIREGNSDWQTLQVFAKIWSSWKPYQYDLTPYCGEEHQPIYIRFRFKSDANTISDPRFGVKIDLLEILVDDEVSIDENLSVTPDKFRLLPAFPNPFNAMVTISYTIPFKGEVRIHIFDLLGNEVCSFQQSHPLPGTYGWQWEGKSITGKLMPSGIYFVQVKCNDQIETRKILMMK
ncbi:MAG: S8 family peptidase, partial [Candidatus Marinimicrobia bacterium]|nr:S8 family peptidase [Candidatus Neomarinimicrobiota bacterium]